MFIPLGSPNTLRSIQPQVVNPKLLRSRYKVLAIDDEGFPPQQKLMSSGYQVTAMSDLESTYLAQDYQIVICDVKGVGKKLGGKHEGAYLIKEIRNHFPDKYIILSTSYTWGPQYNEYFRKADVSVAKDVDDEVWIDVLDTGIATMADPRIRWKRLRRYLLEEGGVDTFVVARLEHAFVGALRQGHANQFNTATERLLSGGDTRDLLASFSKSLFSDLAANLIVAAIT